MTPELKKFIQDNKYLINENSKEGWEEIYSTLPMDERSDFTKVMLVADIDPAPVLEYIPKRYLSYSQLTQYKISNRVTSIGSYAFEGCSNLTSIEIPDSVTSIGYKAFRNCDNLTSVCIKDIAAWCNISFEDQYANPLSNGAELYLNDKLVTDLVIPDSVASIGDYAFYQHKSLKSVAIPDSVISIGDWVFNGCGNLRNIFFNGTKTQWDTIKKPYNWAAPVPAKKVTCSDGEIIL